MTNRITIVVGDGSETAILYPIASAIVRWIACCVISFLFFSLLSDPARADEEQEVKEVLLLASHSLDLAAYDIGLPAFREALRSAVNGNSIRLLVPVTSRALV